MPRFVRFRLAKEENGFFILTDWYTRVNPEMVQSFGEVARTSAVAYTRIEFPDGSYVVRGTEDEVHQALLGTPLEQLAETSEED